MAAGSESGRAREECAQGGFLHLSGGVSAWGAVGGHDEDPGCSQLHPCTPGGGEWDAADPPPPGVLCRAAVHVGMRGLLEPLLPAFLGHSHERGCRQTCPQGLNQGPSFFPSCYFPLCFYDHDYDYLASSWV